MSKPTTTNTNTNPKPETWFVFDTSILNTFKPISIKEGQKELDVSFDLLNNENQASEIIPANLEKDDQEIKLTAITAPGVIFETEAQRIAHYKTDWHLWNLKLKSAGLPLLTKPEFLEKKENAELNDITETIAEEELSEEEKPNAKPLRGSNRIRFITQDSKEISLWKNVLIPNPKDRQIELSHYVKAYTELPNKQNWAIFMSSGGRFAGAIFEGKVMIQHKTFVRYTVRKKQGGSQSSKDSQSGTSAPRSAGATMRRYNEKRFREQILEVISSWSDQLLRVHLIFLYAPGINWNYFFAGPNAFKRSDLRIRSVPFTVSRPTLDEVKRIHHILSTIEVIPYNPEIDIIPESTETDPDNEEINEQTIEKPQEIIIQEEDKVSEAIINGKLSDLIALFESDYEIPIQTDVDKIRTPVFLAVEHKHPKILAYLLDLDTGDIDSPIPGWSNRTALHRAVEDESIEMIKMLLNSGANPAPKDLFGQTPYILASKNIRILFRKFAAQNLHMYDWADLGITPLSDEAELQKKKKNAEKNKRKKQNAKIKQQEQQEELLKAQEQKKLEEERAEKQRLMSQIEGSRNTKISNLTEREKRLLAAEARMSAQKGTGECCSFCKKPLTTIPFERLKYKYCSVECVSKHMDEL